MDDMHKKCFRCKHGSHEAGQAQNWVLCKGVFVDARATCLGWEEMADDE